MDAYNRPLWQQDKPTFHGVDKKESLDNRIVVTLDENTKSTLGNYEKQRKHLELLSTTGVELYLPSYPPQPQSPLASELAYPGAILKISEMPFNASEPSSPPSISELAYPGDITSSSDIPFKAPQPTSPPHISELEYPGTITRSPEILFDSSKPTSPPPTSELAYPGDITRTSETEFITPDIPFVSCGTPEPSIADISYLGASHVNQHLYNDHVVRPEPVPSSQLSMAHAYPSYYPPHYPAYSSYHHPGYLPYNYHTQYNHSVQRSPPASSLPMSPPQTPSPPISTLAHDFYVSSASPVLTGTQPPRVPSRVSSVFHEVYVPAATPAPTSTNGATMRPSSIFQPVPVRPIAVSPTMITGTGSNTVTPPLSPEDRYMTLKDLTAKIAHQVRYLQPSDFLPKTCAALNVISKPPAVSISIGPARHECTECGKSYKQRRGLQTHMLVHSGERPFACDRCDATFNRAGTLRVHMRTEICLREKKRPVDRRKKAQPSLPVSVVNYE